MNRRASAETESQAELDDLQVGDRVTALYDPETFLAAEIAARGEEIDTLARVEGVISTVDTEAKTLTIQPIRDPDPAAVSPTTEGEPVMLHVTPNTQITLDGRPARLDDLKRGFSAGAAFDRRTFEAARIADEGFAEVRGTVRDVGAVAHTLTIAPSSGDPAITLTVGPAVPISLNPMFSFLKLADSNLNFYSLLDLKLNAEMVTLSACHTGVNKVFPGDELHGLMRGFLHAGAPSLVASLWATSDASTAKLMKLMYAEISAGASKRAALRTAQLAVKDEYGHPYYWAPFILMGNPTESMPLGIQTSRAFYEPQQILPGDCHP